MRERRAVHALRAQDVDVIELGELLRRKGLRRTQRHVTGVVDHHVDTAGLRNDRRDPVFDRLRWGDIELHRPEIDAMLSRIARGLRDLWGIALRGSAHTGIDGVSRTGEYASRERPEPARCSRDDNDLVHDHLLTRSHRWLVGPER